MNCYQDEFDQTNGLRYLNHAAVAPWPRRAADAVSAFARENVAHGASDYPEWLKIEHRLRERRPTAQCARRQRPRTGQEHLRGAFLRSLRPGLARGRPGRHRQRGVPSIEWSGKPCARAASKWSRSVSPATTPRAPCSPPAAHAPACCRSARCSTPAACALTWSASARDVAAAACCSASTRSSRLGALPFDVQAYDCAFAMADGHKWMLGPEGLGVFYCHPEQRERLALHEYGWHMLEHALDYERRDWRPARSWRFECGSPNMLGAMALEASLGLLEEVGMERVGRHRRARPVATGRSVGNSRGTPAQSAEPEPTRGYPDLQPGRPGQPDTLRNASPGAGHLRPAWRRYPFFPALLHEFDGDRRHPGDLAPGRRHLGAQDGEGIPNLFKTASPVWTPHEHDQY